MYREKLDAYIDSKKEEMLEDLMTLVRIDSQRGEAKTGMPFGEGPVHALEAAQRLMKKYGLATRNYENYVVTGDYPGWKYRVHSPLREKMVKLYAEMYGTEPKVEAIHAGLECGLLGSKITDLDCVSMGPDMKDIHTTEETLSISSTKRVWEYLVRVLETKD